MKFLRFLQNDIILVSPRGYNLFTDKGEYPRLAIIFLWTRENTLAWL
jgi:hypothetical protein